MVPQNSQQLGEKAIFSKTKRYWRLQDKMGGNGLGNRCSIQLSYGTAKSFQSLAQVAFRSSLTIASCGGMAGRAP